jgi:hypothetical protein
MKNYLFLSRAAFLAIALGTAGVTTSFAQATDDSTPPAGAGGHHHHDSVLTADEKAQLKKAYETVMANNQDLKTEQDTLKQQHESMGSDATEDQKKAFHAQMKAFFEKLKTAELQVDPTLTPIFAKLEAAHQKWHHQDQ